MMMRTADPHSPTKARLLDTAERLMLAQGFAATTVDEICAAAKLTKGSFFHYFESKDDLCETLLTRFCEHSAQRHQAAIGRETDPLKRVFGHVDLAIKMSKECAGSRGCLLGTFAQEMADTNPTIRSICAEAFGRWAASLRKDLDQAKAAHPPKIPVDTKSLAEHFIAVLEGSQILAKVNQDAAIIEKSLKHFKNYLKAVFGK